MTMELRELLDLQLSEIELLQCMFPADGEFCVDDPSVLSDVQNFVHSETGASASASDGVNAECVSCSSGAQSPNQNPTAPRQISYALRIDIGERQPRVELRVLCDLPLDYPNAVPEVIVRSDSISRQRQKQLNDDLSEHILSLDRGELCVAEALQWLQENAEKYMTASPTSETIEKQRTKVQITKAVAIFTRMWIHSHHIYSKSKRKDILEWAGDLGLTGFSLPGKPGIICLEGPQDDVEEFWHKIRRLNWKKLTSKHREDIPLSEGSTSDVSILRHFSGFEEISFSVRGGRDYHMDLGQFFHYLEEHGCGDVFKILLGVDGKVSAKGD